jgi:hypothetical protein
MRSKVEIKRDLYCPEGLFKWFISVRGTSTNLNGSHYLHADGTLHPEVISRKTSKYSGRFRTYREARAAIRVYRALKKSH